LGAILERVNCELHRGASDIAHDDRDVENVTHAAGLGEIRRDVRIAKAGPPCSYQFMIGQPQRIAVPVLDHAVEQVEIFRRVDDSGRIAGAEAYPEARAPDAA